jgi:hypothetical protein
LVVAALLARGDFPSVHVGPQYGTLFKYDGEMVLQERARSMLGAAASLASMVAFRKS